MEASDTSEPKTGWRPNWVTEGIILGAISMFAYFLAFSYETGRCEALDIPHELIGVTPLQVFRGGLVYLFVFLYTLARHGRDLLELFLPIPEQAPELSEVAPPVAGGRRKKRSGLHPLAAARRVWNLTLQLIAAGVSWLNGTSLAAGVLQALVLAGIAYGLTVGVSFQQRVWVIFLAALPPLMVSSMERQLEGFPLARSTTRPLRLSVVMLSLCAWLYVFHFCLGFYQARTELDFHVIPGKPERVVLAIYGSHVIAAPLDRTGNHWHPPLTIQNLGDSTTIQLQREQVGPLSKAVQGWPAKPIPSIPAKAPGP